ncbi:hypothetical protein CUJ84_pRLN3000454 (plasmid) [Rhizobium leguminosarum]|uniref:Uncharacterized protein n=1 Tax=Rhizobium leguminosarum TaxID=384 RepID=A0A2K9ZH34_RHILE|nr:hypothetical protein CUJ84_pRLN3000454 [Rhizobium leguminosarum]
MGALLPQFPYRSINVTVPRHPLHRQIAQVRFQAVDIADEQFSQATREGDVVGTLQKTRITGQQFIRQEDEHSD